MNVPYMPNYFDSGLSRHSTQTEHSSEMCVSRCLLPTIDSGKDGCPKIGPLEAAVGSLVNVVQMEGRCKATWKREFKLSWSEAGPPNRQDDNVDLDQ